jgi:hypothetical protein
MKKPSVIITLALIQGFTIKAAFANSDDINVLEIITDNVVVANPNEPNEVNVPPLLDRYKQTRISVSRTRIAALSDDSISKEKISLNKSLVGFNELKIPPARNLQKAVIEAVPPEPNFLQSQSQDVETFPAGHINPKTLEDLAASAKDPNSIAEPLALAQTLYRAGHPKEAIVFYEIAAGRTTAMGRILSSDDKSWILLQIAACYNDAPQKAISILDKLITDYPKSVWASAAVAKRDILQWYLKENPRQLLESPQNEQSR